jgi:hypothetical protein
MLLIAALGAGCSSGGDDEAACAAPRMTGDPALPDGFPTPRGVTYTATREEGPGTVVEGRRDGEVTAAADAYRGALAAAGYRVADAGRAEDEAGIGFAGGGAEGQVKLRACDDRTSIEITVRAA